MLRAERAALNQAYAGRRAVLSKWQRDLLTGVPSARIVELPGANLYVFLSNEARRTSTSRRDRIHAISGKDDVGPKMSVPGEHRC